MNNLLAFLKRHSFHTGVIFVLILGTAASVESQAQDSILKFGHISVEDPAVTLNKYNPILTLISKKIERQLILVQKPSYLEMNEAFLAKEIDMGILNAFSYIQIAEKAGLIPIASRVIGDSSFYQSYIIVRKEDNITRYEDLRGKVFAFSDPNSTTGYLCPKTMLMTHGLDPDKDLKQTPFIGKHDSLVYAVLNRTVDAGAVASYIFEGFRDEIKEKFTVLDKSDPIPLGPFVIRKELDGVLIRKIKYLVLSLHQSEEGLKALQAAQLNRFEDTSDSDYAIIKKIADVLNLQEQK
jgi:phosphonate transport system substrate-binding protein